MGTTTGYVPRFLEILLQVHDSINGSIINTICILIIPNSQYMSQVQLTMSEWFEKTSGFGAFTIKAVTSSAIYSLQHQPRSFQSVIFTLCFQQSPLQWGLSF